MSCPLLKVVRSLRSQATEVRLPKLLLLLPFCGLYKMEGMPPFAPSQLHHQVSTHVTAHDLIMTMKPEKYHLYFKSCSRNTVINAQAPDYDMAHQSSGSLSSLPSTPTSFHASRTFLAASLPNSFSAATTVALANCLNVAFGLIVPLLIAFHQIWPAFSYE